MNEGYELLHNKNIGDMLLKVGGFVLCDNNGNTKHE